MSIVGDADEAEEMLRHAVVAAPSSLAPRLALISYLEERERFTDAEAMAIEAIRLWPDDPDTQLAMARNQFYLAQYKQAAGTLERLLTAAPTHAQGWFQYGRLARYTYALPPGAAERAFEHAAEYAETDHDLLEQSAQYFLHELHFSKAAKIYDRLMQQKPNALENLATCRDYAASLSSSGRPDEAAAILLRSIERCRSYEPASSAEDWELFKREEALLLLQAGRTDEATQTLRSIRDAAASGPNYNRAEYLPRTPERLARLRDIVRGRDVVAFLTGPSFADFAARIAAIVNVDFATATLGSFPPVEQELSRRIGRTVDMLLVTHPSMVRSWFPELQRFLSRPSPNSLLTVRYALSGLGELGTAAAEFVARYDERLLFAQHAGGPPLPSRPLHFQHSNSLGLLLPLLVLSRPRRIFLVGADGGGHPRMKRPYFFYEDVDKESGQQDFLERPDLLSYQGNPERLEETNRRLRVEAISSDETLRRTLLFIEGIFDVPIPPIYNVCPHSSHVAYPRIDVETAMAMLRDESS